MKFGRHFFNIGDLPKGPFYECAPVDKYIEELETIIIELRKGKALQDLRDERDRLRSQLYDICGNCTCGATNLPEP